jgi:alpha-tubulin suppressor-like RCC1 family protein
MVSTGYYHSCALISGVAKCWGRNTSGQLGNGSNTNATAMTPVDTTGAMAGKTITGVFAGGATSCAVASTGEAYCWGEGSLGQLGNGATSDSTTPVAVSTAGVLSGVTLTAVAVGGAVVCALSGAGNVYCWGHGGEGDLGNGANADSAVPVPVSLGGVIATELTPLDGGMCVLGTDDRVYCWGYNGEGSVGDGTRVNRNTPTPVSTGGSLGGRTIVQIASGGYTACAVDSTQAAYCWGNNDFGQLGDGTSNLNGHGNPLPQPVDLTGVAGHQFASVAVGFRSACALTPAGTAYCWGQNADGELGDGTTNDHPTPAAVDTSDVLNGVTLRHIATGGGFHYCAISVTDVISCWGQGFFGQLGNRASIMSTVPVRTQVVPVAPTAPTGVMLTAGDQRVTVSWDAPSNSGSAAITGYTASVGGGHHCTTTGALSCDITGLTNGQTYLATVTATSADGTSPVSSPSNTAVPHVVPGAPTSVVVTPGDTTAAVSWTAPASMGSGTFLRYTATATPGGATCQSTGLACTIAGLTNGTTYTVGVVTETSQGNSAAGPSGPVTPGLPVLAPAPPAHPDGTLHSTSGTTFDPATRTTTLTGTGFAPNTPVVLGVYSTLTPLGTAITDSAGNFAKVVTVPAGLSGTHTFVATGSAPGGGPRTLALTVRLGGAALPVTGPQIMALTGFGLLLVAVGVALAYRRRLWFTA